MVSQNTAISNNTDAITEATTARAAAITAEAIRTVFKTCYDNTEMQYQ
jgi:hypothetical protein